MLKSRLLTAFIMGPLVLWAVFSLPNNLFALFAAILVTLGAWEWSAFSGWSKALQRSLFVAINILLFVAVLFLQNHAINLIIISASLFWWLISIPLLISFPLSGKHLLYSKITKSIVGMVLLLATLVAMVMIRNNPDQGPKFALYIILIIWFADSGAYFAGRAFGKNKLIPNVSPGKTWEGVAGALVITLIAALVAVNILHIPASHSVFFILLTLVTVIYSVVGDLSESMFKRMADIKDSGHILPGHGGILDRIDSLMSALPVFFAGLWLMEKVV